MVLADQLAVGTLDLGGARAACDAKDRIWIFTSGCRTRLSVRALAALRARPRVPVLGRAVGVALHRCNRGKLAFVQAKRKTQLAYELRLVRYQRPFGADDVEQQVDQNERAI